MVKNPAERYADSQEPPFKPPKRKAKKKRKAPIVILCILLIIIAAGILFVLRRRATPALASSDIYITEEVRTRDITVTLNGSGTLEPADSYTVTTSLAGELLSSDFDEGDNITEGAVLYTIDTKTADQNIKTAQTNLETAEQSLERAQRNYNDLLGDISKHNEQREKTLSELPLYSKYSGQIIKLYVEAGDTLSVGMPVADILDSNFLLVTLPFLPDEALNIAPGHNAIITLSQTGETLNGTVESISPVNTTGAYGISVRNVTIKFPNPGAMTDNMRVTAEVGDFVCNDEGTTEYSVKETITAQRNGDIEELFFAEGDIIYQGETLLRLAEPEDTSNYDSQINSSLDSIRDAERTLDSRRDALQQAIDALDDYTITSPIEGTVIEKNYKAGDSVGGSAGAQTALAIIYDLSSLTFVMNIDELDIASIEVGQFVTITSDAVSGRVYSGEVIRKSVKGTTSGGVTSYPVTISISEPEGLLPGMNITAEIAVTDKKDVVAIPNAALQRGNRVLVKKAAADQSAVVENFPVDREDANFADREGANFAGREGANFAGREGANFADREGIEPGEREFVFEAPQSAASETVSGIPEGYELIQVVPGVTDGDYIEILEGLSPGDSIAYADTSAVSSQANFQPGQFGGFGGNVGRTGAAQGANRSEYVTIVGGAP